MAKVTLEKLTKIYPETAKSADFHAVRGIDLEINDGEFMVLVGPSGCGKSTTLRMIAGLEDVTSGTIALDGRTVNVVPPKDRDIAMVFQNYALYPHMSVFENLAFGLKLQRVPKNEISRRVLEAATMLGIEELLARKPKGLSGGQRQRVALGRAIVRQPKVFLFDEPLSNLDAKMRVSTRMELSKLHDRLGTTMIYVTHDQVEAMTMGDRICVMKDGHIMQVAEPLALYNHPASLYVAGFIGSPGMNFFRGRIEPGLSGRCFRENNPVADPLVIDLPRERFATVAPGAEVVLGIRPEDITHVTSPSGNPTGRARLELLEPMGAETYLHLTTGASPFIARVAPSVPYKVGDMVGFTLVPEKLHLFDAASEAALT